MCDDQVAKFRTYDSHFCASVIGTGVQFDDAHEKAMSAALCFVAH